MVHVGSDVQYLYLVSNIVAVMDGEEKGSGTLLPLAILHSFCMCSIHLHNLKFFSWSPLYIVFS